MTRLGRSLSGNGVDVLVVVGLIAACAAYLISFPHRLGAADEGLILYEAKRLLAGDVYFRDLFEIIPPGSQYLVAAAYWLFGTTIVTARVVDAAVQSLIAGLIYTCGRTAGARRSLAGLAALLHPVLFQPVWPYVSPHWMSTALALVLLWVCLRRPWARRRAGAAWVGVVLGLMALVQHQRAVPFAAGAVALLTLDALVGRRFGDHTTAAIVAERVATCAVAALLVAAPPFIALAAAAGAEPVLRGLVVFPVVNYHAANWAPWGGTWLMTAQNAIVTVPALLRWAPLALVGAGVLAATGWWYRARLDDVRMALAIAVIGAAQIAAILYFPDLIHLAFLAPICAVAAAVVGERQLRRLDALPHAAAATAIVAVGLAALLGWRAAWLRSYTWGRIITSAPTKFGRIDFDDRHQASLVAHLTPLTAATPGQFVLCYPACPALYLMTDTRNPTPFQIILPGYNAADQVAVAMQAIEQRRTSLVVLTQELLHRDDPVIAAVADRYRPVPGEPMLWQLAPATQVAP